MIGHGARAGGWRRGAALAVAVAMMLLPSPARAQSAADQAAAEALFKQARDLMAAGKYAVACPKLAESQRLDPGTGTLLNLATCYEKNGQITSAWATFKVAATAAQNANEGERARMAKARAAALEPTLPVLTIVVPQGSDRPDLTVKRDGEVIGRPAWGTPIPVDPGAHAVQASAPGRKTWVATVQVPGPGAKESIEVPPLEAEPVATPPAPPPPAGAAVPGRTPAPPPPPPPAPASTGDTQRTIGLIVGGAGIASLGVGIAEGLVAKQKNDDAYGTPSAPNCNGTVCNAQGIALRNSAESAATVSTVTFLAGGAAVVAGAVLFLTAPHAPVQSTTGWTLAPGGGGALAGISLLGVWR